jgi:hypothetical protein
MEKKLRQARKEGLISSEYFGHQIDEAEKAEIFSAKETAELRDYHEKVLYLLSVDDFSPEEIGRNSGSGEDTEMAAPPSATAASSAVVDEPVSKPAKKKKAKKKASRKKPAKKKS